MSKHELIRKYEPVLLFSKDDDGNEENFLPVSTANYVAESSLQRSGEGTVRERKKVTLDYLGQLTSQESRQLYLSFAADEVLRHDPSFRERLSHDGMAMFGIESFEEDEETPEIEGELEDDLLLDPAADVSYGLREAMHLPPEVHSLSLERYEPYRDYKKYPPLYYYNVIYNRGFLVLQYYFFYAFNDWGTAHNGVNDHEGDWEMISLFMQKEKPAYVAYSAHTGAPEFHAWDDSALEKHDGMHPVVYVGCGSHANYFHSTVHKTASFKDFAHGNSDYSIGSGAKLAWGEPVDLGTAPWALNYAGGWGARVERFGSNRIAAGAQSPSGPVWQFQRWESPVGWARLPY